ncbi:MAG: 50S ribosomal protein L24 [Candidatus Woesearchaeota archaeon]
MASKWNKSWRASVQPRKQRAYVRKAPVHARGDFVSAHLSKELKQKYKCRSLRLRAGDKVKIMRGSFRNKTGKIDRINVKEQKVYITGIELTKRDGSKAMCPVHPSNVVIQELDLTDKRRLGGKQ